MIEKPIPLRGIKYIRNNLEKSFIKYLIYGDKEYFCRPKNALQNGLKLLI